MSPYKQHCEKWKDGCGSALCEFATRVIFARGKIPCDVLFIGEAPGESENVLGIPFAGPAGKLLDRIIKEVLESIWDSKAGPDDLPRIAFTNIVGCIPRDEFNGNKATEPDTQSIKKCAPRLKEFLAITRPSLVVRVGQLSTKWATESHICPDANRAPSFVDIVHPAAILRANIAQQGLAIQRCVVTLSNAFEELL